MYSKCAWVAGIIQKHVAGRPVTYDASSLAGLVLEVSGGKARCRLCGRAVRLAMLKHHLQLKHCDRLLELLEKHKLARTRAYGGGGAGTLNVQLYCTGCGWSHSITVKSNTGPPDIKRLLEKTGLTECPACGKRFEVRGFEFKRRE